MLEKVTTVKAKPETIVCRVASDLKEYVNEAANGLHVSTSAYVIQLIENDRQPHSVVLNMNADVLDGLMELKKVRQDETLSDTINQLLQDRIDELLKEVSHED